MNKYINFIVAILSTLVMVIPLVQQLVKYVKKAVREKNWPALLRIITNLMEEAELKFETGAERKKWVLGMIEASAKTINYAIDMELVSQLIDSLCAMAKNVNNGNQYGFTGV